MTEADDICTNIYRPWEYLLSLQHGTHSTEIKIHAEYLGQFFHEKHGFRWPWPWTGYHNYFTSNQVKHNGSSSKTLWSSWRSYLAEELCVWSAAWTVRVLLSTNAKDNNDTRISFLSSKMRSKINIPILEWVLNHIDQSLALDYEMTFSQTPRCSLPKMSWQPGKERYRHLLSTYG